MPATGPRTDAITLTRLAAGDGGAERAAVVEPARNPRETPLLVVHLAARVLGDVVLASWLRDGTTLRVDPERLGVVPDDGRWRSWIEAEEPEALAPEALGAACGRALGAIVATISPLVPARPSAVARLARDYLHRYAQHHVRHTGRSPHDPTIRAFMVGAGDPPRPRRALALSPDAGPAVELHLPTACCVLRRGLTPGSCPTCPRHPNDQARHDATLAWLRSLDDAQFRAVTGRARQT